jgi:hypothetical protein
VIDATGDPGVVHTQVLDAVSSVLGAQWRLSAAETGRP